jgi:hypothetical protein
MFVKATQNHLAIRYGVSCDVVERERSIVRRAESDLDGAPLRLLEWQALVECQIGKEQGTHAIRRLTVYQNRTIERVAKKDAKGVELPVAERFVADGERKVAEAGPCDLGDLVVSARLAGLAQVDDGLESCASQGAPGHGVGLARRCNATKRTGAVRDRRHDFA